MKLDDLGSGVLDLEFLRGQTRGLGEGEFGVVETSYIETHLMRAILSGVPLGTDCSSCEAFFDQDEQEMNLLEPIEGVVTGTVIEVRE